MVITLSLTATLTMVALMTGPMSKTTHIVLMTRLTR